MFKLIQPPICQPDKGSICRRQKQKQKTNRTKNDRGLRKKVFRKFTGMVLRNEIGVTKADRINLLVSRTVDEKHSIA